jgi:penicillin-binding protein 1A
LTPDRVKNLLQPPGPGHWKRVLLNLGVCAGVAALVAGGAALAAYEVIKSGLPKMDTLADYRPNLVTEVYDREGQLIGEFMYENQRRYLVAVTDVPQHVIQAFVAAEDRTFFTHHGLDYTSILRAAWANLHAREIKQGGSTITQQVVKSLLLSPERTYLRKVREMVLAKRIEDRLNKNEILHLYLNQIYFGSGAYGVQAAAREFFAKDVGDLTLAEGALLAGLVQAPGRFNPRLQPEKARDRRRYVLTRMLDDGFISREAFAQAEPTPLGVKERRDVTLEKAPDYVEHVRRALMKKYGAEKVLKDGLRVTAACDLRLQGVARDALNKGLRVHARRQNLLTIPETVPQKDWPARLAALARQNENLRPDEVHEGLVLTVDDEAGWARIDLGGPTIRAPFAQMKWPTKVQRGDRVFSVGTLHRVSQLLRPGDRVLVYREKADRPYTLAAWPSADGALLAMDVNTRQVLAMIGGKDFAGSQFNRAVQARRQPGSAFKPIVYAAALNAGLTPATVFADTALIFGDNWRPANYDHTFHGYMTLRQALTHSVNTVTIRVAEMLGVDYIVRFARRLGLLELHGGDLSMALGTYEVTPLELVNAYEVFATGGKWGEPVFIRKVADRSGAVLEDATLSDFVEQPPPMTGVPDLRRNRVVDQPPADANEAVPKPPADDRLVEFLHSFGVGPKPAPTPSPAAPQPQETPEPRGEIPARVAQEGRPFWRQVLDPQVAYVITTMLHSVATEGTGARASALGRTVAGKTGTTSDYKDAWFVGFSPQVIAGVWVGFDKGGLTLGSGESGSSAALPIWIDFMKVALEDQPNIGFTPPPGLVYARVDPQTGLLAQPDAPGYNEVFVAGAEPTEYAPSAAAPQPQDFFKFEIEGDR